MKKLDTFRTLSRTIVIGVLSIAFRPARDLLPEAGGVWLTGGVLLVWVITFHCAQLAVESLIESNRWLRQFILGKESIEGTWIDHTKARGKSVSCVSHVEICYSSNSWQLFGLAIAADGEVSGRWRSRFAVWNDSVLSYRFESHGTADSEVIQVGFGELSFSSDRKSYTGFVLNKSSETTQVITGEKVLDKKTIKSLRTKGSEIRMLQLIRKQLSD